MASRICGGCRARCTCMRCPVDWSRSLAAPAAASAASIGQHDGAVTMGSLLACVFSSLACCWIIDSFVCVSAVRSVQWNVLHSKFGTHAMRARACVLLTQQIDADWLVHSAVQTSIWSVIIATHLMCHESFHTVSEKHQYYRVSVLVIGWRYSIRQYIYQLFIRYS